MSIPVLSVFVGSVVILLAALKFMEIISALKDEYTLYRHGDVVIVHESLHRQ